MNIMPAMKLDKTKRYLLIAGAALLSVAVIYRFFPFWEGMLTTSSEITVKEKQLARYQRTVNEGKEINDRLVSLSRTLARAETGFLKGKTPSLAAVEIQNILNEIMQGSDVEVKSVRILKPEKLRDDEKYLTVPVQFVIISTIRRLKEILYRIETAPQNLKIKSMRINVVGRGEREQIYSDITVEGFVRSTEG